jgi:hypothetical protein
MLADESVYFETVFRLIGIALQSTDYSIYNTIINILNYILLSILLTFQITYNNISSLKTST